MRGRWLIGLILFAAQSAYPAEAQFGAEVVHGDAISHFELRQGRGYVELNLTRYDGIERSARFTPESWKYLVGRLEAIRPPAHGAGDCPRDFARFVYQDRGQRRSVTACLNPEAPESRRAVKLLNLLTLAIQ